MFKRVSTSLGWMLLLVAVCVGAEEAQVVASRRVGSDTLVFDGTVRIDQPVPGDLIAADGSVDVDAPVAGGAMLAGCDLRVTAKV
jgi:hypothetical protein